ncbi:MULTISPECIES: acetate uptake transporter [Bacillaceae]|jgi:succinate-acetate transporter protein|uniref:Acetate uptake transporter n=1 Tax=Metabacillus hrfriensis TaxID=3048891 RepID=A0ACD4RGY8_9BACI|nr:MULTISPECIES: acetate uptake transporter [Bacillaceae]UOK59397.1 acetate uptake transporter [Bacillus sp. OVS6]USK30338.1 acetate uptake transporter [Bacillus sp. CMF21]MDQ0860386.1 succinate-acetate transporter protein [Bacillus sp. V2I10]UAL54021.1 acetate uptake transporter [Metabacillus dongyingensis]WHZ59588.1 acetate uptake transporter [Metabacillus sp. CT-WN-B3]
MNNQNVQQVKMTTADPSALGLFGLAMVTLVASSQKLGLTEGLSFILPWAIFLGGFAQLFACINDAKHNNTFGTTAFGAFGLFWLGVGGSWLIQLGVFGEELAASVDPKQLGFAFVGYLIFSLFMTIGAMETHKVLFFIFVLIDFLFIGLSLSSFGIMHEATHMLAAVSEMLIALLSFYGSAAAVLNAHFGRVFLPIGKPFGIFKK